MFNQNEISRAAYDNYSQSDPWPTNDAWHCRTSQSEREIIERWLSKHVTPGMKILNAGSGGTEYKTNGKLIHLDIIKEYIDHFSDYIVGPIEHIELEDESLDGVICVGSVLNYADAQRAVSEFCRILKDGGFLILEFERSDSAEFINTGMHGKYLFSKKYQYNGHDHLLWLYSERHIRHILMQYHFKIRKCRRIHCLSSLLNRFGVSEKVAAPYARFDRLFQAISYPFAHNVMLFATKKIPSERDNGQDTGHNRNE